MVDVKYKYYPPRRLGSGSRSNGLLIKYSIDRKNNICKVEEISYYPTGIGHMTYTKDINTPFIGVRQNAS